MAYEGLHADVARHHTPVRNAPLADTEFRNHAGPVGGVFLMLALISTVVFGAMTIGETGIAANSIEDVDGRTSIENSPVNKAGLYGMLTLASGSLTWLMSIFVYRKPF